MYPKEISLHLNYLREYLEWLAKEVEEKKEESGFDSGSNPPPPPPHGG